MKTITKTFITVMLMICPLSSTIAVTDSQDDILPDCSYVQVDDVNKTQQKSRKINKALVSYASSSQSVYRLLWLMKEHTKTDEAVIECLSNTYYEPLEPISRETLTQMLPKVELVLTYFRMGSDGLIAAIDNGKISVNENFSIYENQNVSLIGLLLMNERGRIPFTLAKDLIDRGVDIVPLDLLYIGYGKTKDYKLIELLVAQLDSDEIRLMWTEPGTTSLPWDILSKTAAFGDNKELEIMLERHVGDNSYALYMLLSKLKNENNQNPDETSRLISNIKILLEHGARIFSSSMDIVQSKLIESESPGLLKQYGQSNDELTKLERKFLNDILKLD
ncbi:hypothetical protein [Neptunicella sp.]|uniref:hypothetical protein n=1 Tax=Neptunicella sp. TaxID=2125986 RepID=UPI003F68D229